MSKNKKMLPSLARYTMKGAPKDSWLKDAIPIFISIVGLGFSIWFSIIFSRDRDYAKIRYDQQLQIYTNLLDVANDLKEQAYGNDGPAYQSELSKFDHIYKGQMLLIDDPALMEKVQNLQASIKVAHAMRNSTEADSLKRQMEASFNDLITEIKTNMSKNQF